MTIIEGLEQKHNKQSKNTSLPHKNRKLCLNMMFKHQRWSKGGNFVVPYHPKGLVPGWFCAKPGSWSPLIIPAKCPNDLRPLFEKQRKGCLHQWFLRETPCYFPLPFPVASRPTPVRVEQQRKVIATGPLHRNCGVFEVWSNTCQNEVLLPIGTFIYLKGILRKNNH